MLAAGTSFDVREAGLGVARSSGAILFVDIFESVRLVGCDEESFIRRWLAIMGRTRSEIIPACGGALIKGTGDGFLATFGSSPTAVRAAQSIAALVRTSEELEQPDASLRIHLRMGLSSGSYSSGAGDVFGRDVNLAARLMSLAKPGEIIVSERIRDELTEGLDASLEDLGLCWVRNVAEPIRAFRLRAEGISLRPGRSLESELTPGVAIFPLAPRFAAPEVKVLGEVFAEECSRLLGRSAYLSVISRLSATAAAGRGLTARELRQATGADFLLCGSFDLRDGRLSLNLDLVDLRDDRLIWSDVVTGPVEAIHEAGQPLIHEVAAAVSRAIAHRELARARMAPMRNLRSYTLLLAAVASLHRLARSDFEFARELLETLIERDPRHSTAHAWLAYWHAMKAHQGWSDDRRRDAALAAEASGRAMDLDPDCSLSKSIDGTVNANLFHRLDVARARYDAAIAEAPSEAMAWLMRAALGAFEDRGAEAVQDARTAIRLSPLDPRRYLFETILASAHLTAGEDEAALEAATEALRLNRIHGSALRVKTVAAWRLGREGEARAALGEMMSLEPLFSVRGYMARAANPGARITSEIARSLSEAGAPA